MPGLVFTPTLDAAGQPVRTADGKGQVGTYSIQSIMSVVYASGSNMPPANKQQLKTYFNN